MHMPFVGAMMQRLDGARPIAGPLDRLETDGATTAGPRHSDEHARTEVRKIGARMSVIDREDAGQIPFAGSAMPGVEA